MDNIAVFGDSIAWGKNDNANGGWVGLLRKYLEENRVVGGVYNLSVDGDTSKGVLARFEIELAPREINKIIFAVGINDSLYRTSFNNTETHIGEFESNINTLINNSKKLHGAIVFVGLTNVDERFTKPLSYSETGKCYDNTLIAKYNNKLKEIAARSNVPFINVYGILAPEEIDDGVHPNTEGHHTLYE